jgi:hypothetical protein
MIFWRKIVIFHTKYPKKMFAPPNQYAEPCYLFSHVIENTKVALNTITLILIPLKLE